MSIDELGDKNQIVTGGFATVGRYGVIGHPVAHSRSPELHNAWFREARRPGTYERVEISPTELIRRGPSLPYEFAGLNVTIPHKVSILGYVDRIDEEAEAAGAANVLYRSRGDQAWTASNTDGPGFVRALEDATAEPVMGKDCVVLGAGGAARAIGASLVRKGAASVLFINRTEERAQEVCEAVGANGWGPLHPEILDMLAHSVDLVVNTLPPAAEAVVGSLDLSPLGSHAIVCDINYYLDKPSLLRRGNQAGLFTLDGMGMFLWQAALSFQLWTGTLPDLELGRRVLAGE
jgi:shikimate dehydrogenase